MFIATHSAASDVIIFSVVAVAFIAWSTFLYRTVTFGRQRRGTEELT